MMSNVVIFWNLTDHSVPHPEIQILRKAREQVTRVHGSVDVLMRAAFRERPRAICALDADAEDILRIASLKASIVWDLARIGDQVLVRLNEDASYAAILAKALARVDVIANAPSALRGAIEDRLTVGIPAIDLAEALTQTEQPIAVVLGSGLGNMMNATPMIRWLAERTGRRINIIIHGGAPVGVELFNNAPWINFVFPGYEYTLGRHYYALIVTSLAGHSEPFCTADRWVQQNKIYNYNLEGRFIREADVYFLGLDALFGETPALDTPLPHSFLRDVKRVPDGPRVVGIANGIKQGTWAKRQWPYMPDFADRLIQDGWTVRCFGLPEELVPGTEDWTGLSIRETIDGIARCTYFIGHDGGMVHIAETLGVPTLWLFGPTAYLKNGPFYEQSVVLSSYVPCGPCNFKIDWVRCGDPVCMTSITVESALEAFERVRDTVARLGYEPVWRKIDRTSMAYETGSLERSTKLELQPRLRSERLIAFPIHPVLQYAVIGDLLRVGDLDGAASAAEAALIQYPGNDLIAAINKALAILRNCAEERSHSFKCDEIIRTIVKAALTPAQTRSIVELLFQSRLYGGANSDAIRLYKEMAKQATGTLAKWAVKQWIRAALLLTPAEVRGAEAEFRKLAQENKGLTQRLNHALDETAVRSAWGAFLGDVAADTPTTPLAFGRDKIFSRSLASAPPVSLRIAGKEYELAPWSTVALVVRGCDPSVRIRGLASRFFLRLARRLAAYDLCPIIFSTCQATERPPFEFRDNVSFVNGSTLWSQAIWQQIWDDTRPALVLSVDGTLQQLNLASSRSEATLSMTSAGLHDATGIGGLISDELGLLSTLPAVREGLPIETVFDALPVPQANGFGSKSRNEILVIVNDSSHFEALMRLIRRVPNKKFAVISDRVHRGPENNIRIIQRRLKHNWSAELERAGIVLQYDRAVGSLCAEVYDALRNGVPVVAASSLMNGYLQYQNLFKPANPSDDQDWVEALHAAAQARECVEL
jgi:hypothetical protein